MFCFGRTKKAGAGDAAKRPTCGRRPRVYVATLYAHKHYQRAIASRLEDLGYEITYDWTTNSESVYQEDDREKRLAEIATNDVAGVMSADAVVVLLPGGTGTHAELGMAIGAGKAVVVIGDQTSDAGYDCIFYHVPTVKREFINGVNWQKMTPHGFDCVAAHIDRNLKDLLGTVR